MKKGLKNLEAIHTQLEQNIATLIEMVLQLMEVNYNKEEE